MADQKHFKYESKNPVVSAPSSKDENVEIKDVRFLTPAKITLNVNGTKKEEIVTIDLINRSAYRDNVILPYSKQIFDYLDSINNLPENFFEASEEIYNQVEETRAEHDKMQEIGDSYGEE